ncbi:hypothetical protein [Streptococcus pantholopis]|uniref:Uncharacterized protein n=1 Tax=Streptococcus pantholopis TaxID=1811193 RepID=A0A172Q7C0_9STRE|nr:hypothetical protein [Streptococcus pantholopis]AND79317.1 hypothetical protein A0O21_04380 [Streptococcus pantholopis]
MGIKINALSLEELEAAHGGMLKSRQSASQTGYGYSVKSRKQMLENDYVYLRYQSLLAAAAIERTQSQASQSYDVVSLYEHIKETGKHFDGSPASALEIKIANSGVVPYISKGVHALQWGASIATAYAGYQSYYGKPIYGVDTDLFGQSKTIGSFRVLNGKVDGKIPVKVCSSDRFSHFNYSPK